MVEASSSSDRSAVGSATGDTVAFTGAPVSDLVSNSTRTLMKLVPSANRVLPESGLVRAVLPSVKVVVPATGLVRAVAPLSQTTIPVERLVRHVCADAPLASSIDAHNSWTVRAMVTL